MWARLFLVAVPVILSLALVAFAASDDSYTDDGQSHWDRHPSGQVALIVALLINGFSVATALVSRGERVVLWIATGVAALGIGASFLAWLALSLGE